MNRPMSKPSVDLLRNVRLFSELDERDLESLAEEFNERFRGGDDVEGEADGGEGEKSGAKKKTTKKKTTTKKKSE